MKLALPRRTVLRWMPALPGLAGVASAASTPAAPAQPGERVAWPTVSLLDGQPFGPAQVAGRAVVVVFFTTSCPFCRRHNRHLQRLHAEAPSGLVVLGAAREVDAALVRRHAAHEGYRFPMTLQTEPLAAVLSRRRLVPLTVTLARDGTLRQVIPGEMSEEDVLSLARLAAV